MHDRRTFLRGMASASLGGVGLLAPRFVGSALGQTQEKRVVMIGGKRVKTIDMHAHCVISDVVQVLKGTRFGGLLGPGAQAQSLIGAFDPQRRMAAMDRDAVDVQVLGINTFWYKADRDISRRIIDTQNQKLGEIVKASSGRFEAYASVAMQFPELAAEQLEEGVKTHGLRGAFVACTVGEDELSAAKFDPFWAKAEQLDVPIFIHPQDSANSTGISRRLHGSGALTNVIGNPLETTIALAHFIFDGTLDRFPRLKIIAAHGGGYLPSYAARMDHGCEVFPKQCAGPKLQKRPTEYLNQIYVDSLVFTGEGLRHLIAECGIGQVVLGTDSPVPWVKDPVGHVMNAESLKDEDRAAILHGNAARLLKLDA